MPCVGEQDKSASAPTLAERINCWRKEAGMSVAQLAAASGVKPSVAYKWIRGEVEPTLTRTKAIADACGVSLQIFFGRLPGGSDGATGQ